MDHIFKYSMQQDNVLVFQTQVEYFRFQHHVITNKSENIKMCVFQVLVDTEFNFLGEIFKSILNDVKFVCTNLQLCTSKTNVLFLPKCSHSFPIQSKEYLGNTATYCLKVIVTKIWSSVLSLIIARFGYHAFIISNN